MARRALLPTLLCGLGLGVAQAQELDHLAEMPSAERVVADQRGAGPRETAARALAALDALSSLVKQLSGERARTGALLPPEQSRLGEYSRASDAVKTAEEARYDPACQGAWCEKSRLAQCRLLFLTSPAFDRELVDRYFSEGWRSRHLDRLGGPVWPKVRELPAGTRFAWTGGAVSRYCDESDRRPPAAASSGPDPAPRGGGGPAAGPPPGQNPRLDVVGIKVGMSVEAARAAVRAHDRRMRIKERKLIVTLAPGRVKEVTALLESELTGLPDADRLEQQMRGEADHLDLLLSLGPGPATVVAVHRSLRLHVPHAMMRASLVEKYGEPSSEDRLPAGEPVLYWFYDAAGRPLPRTGPCAAEGGYLAGTRLTDIERYGRESGDPARARVVAEDCGAHVQAVLSLDSGSVTRLDLTVTDDWQRLRSVEALGAFLRTQPGPGAPKL